MKRIIILSAFIAYIFLGAEKVQAGESLVFDSTDNYLGACQLTDTSVWELKEDLAVSTFEVWYSWNQGESTLPVKVLFNGEKFAEFEAVRGNCDPYQQQWCNADYQIHKLFPKGTYSTEIPNKRQCLKPNGTGTIRLYADGSSDSDRTPTSTPTLSAEPTLIATNQPNSCSCNQTTIVVTAVATSVASSFLFSLFLRKH